jgi:hypothetical protein
VYFYRLFSISILLASTFSFASSDGEYQFFDYQGLPILSPANDTRINLALILADQHKIELGKVQDRLSDRHERYNASVDAQTTDQEINNIIENFYKSPTEIDQQKVRVQQTNSHEEIFYSAKPLIIYWLSAPSLSIEDRQFLFSSLFEKDIKITNLKLSDWADYLKARRYFYENKFSESKEQFLTLTHSSDPWIAEASSYNLIRVALRSAFPADSYGFIDESNINSSFGSEAINAIKTYLNTYPNGVYSESAKALKRRAAWIQRNPELIASTYADLIAQMPNTNDQNINWLQEMDYYGVFFRGGYNRSSSSENSSITNSDFLWQAPQLLAAQWLFNLRKGNHLDKNWKNLLIEHKKIFVDTNQLVLFQYLNLAAEFFGERNYKQVIESTETWQDLLADQSVFSTSIICLRSFALEASGRLDDGLYVLTTLQKSRKAEKINAYIETTVAANLLWSKKLMDVFSSSSPIKNSQSRISIIQTSANASELQQLIDMNGSGASISETEKKQEQEAAFHTLQQKLVRHGNFKELYESYLRNQKKYVDYSFYIAADADQPPDLDCKNIEELFLDLSNPNPKAKSKLCLTLISNDMNNSNIGFFDAQQKKDDLGQSFSFVQYGDDNFKGQRPTNFTLWQEVVADTDATDEFKAYALHKLVQCFSPNTYSQCIDGYTDETPQEQRKAWFMLLKNKYKNTLWGKKQKYYW